MINCVIASEEENVLEWLSPSRFDFSKAQNSARATHTSGTGQWLLEDERYIKWRDETCGIFWLYGAGKFPLGQRVVLD
jgi:hypothetical protein